MVENMAHFGGRGDVHQSLKGASQKGYMDEDDG